MEVETDLENKQSIKTGGFCFPIFLVEGDQMSAWPSFEGLKQTSREIHLWCGLMATVMLL